MKSKFGTRSRRYAAALLAMSCVATSAGCDRSESTQAPSPPTLVLERPPAGMKPRAVEFDGKVRLLGYTKQGAPMKAGKRTSVTLYWQAKEKIEPGYRLVSQLLDDAGERILDLDNAGPLREHKDGKPVLPPDAWEPGKVYVDQLSFAVPASVKTWRVQLVAGLKKGEEAMKLNEPDALDGMTVVTTSSTGVRRPPQPKAAPALQVDRLDPKQKLNVDGKLDEAAWKEAPLATFGDTNTPINVRLLYDKAGFYFGFEVKDSDILGGFNVHSAPKDVVIVGIDPDAEGDSKDYYEINVSPENVVFDTQYDSDGKPSKEPGGPFGHEEWSAQMKSAATFQGTLDKADDKDEGYVVEAFVPWKAFTKAKTTPPNLGDTWRLNFFVIQDSKILVWVPVKDKAEFHKTSSYGKVLWAEKGFVPKSGTPEGAAASSAAPPAGQAVADTAGAAQKGVASKPPGAPAAQPPPKPPAAPVAPPPKPPAAPVAPAPKPTPATSPAAPGK